MDIFAKIKRKLLKLRLQPIRVFCLHHVSDDFDPSYMWECDWVNTDVLKTTILEMRRKGYRFISLFDAHRHLNDDVFRFRKYAVLTVDDGFRTLLHILPWLKEQQIPITLFINPKYVLDDTIGLNVQEKLNQNQSKLISSVIYLKKEDIEALQSPLMTFAYHGYEHLDEWNMDESAFEQNVVKCIEKMQDFPNVIPFYAHTYGHAKSTNDEILRKRGLIPVYVSGNKNYNDASHIDRELISNERFEKGLLR